MQGLINQQKMGIKNIIEYRNDEESKEEDESQEQIQPSRNRGQVPNQVVPELVGTTQADRNAIVDKLVKELFDKEIFGDIDALLSEVIANHPNRAKWMYFKLKLALNDYKQLSINLNIFIVSIQINYNHNVHYW